MSNNGIKYRLVASCNPHDAFRHYHGEDILTLNGRTPVEWIVDGCASLTLSAARQKLEEIANSKEMNNYFDKEAAQERAQCAIDDHGNEMTPEELADARAMPWFRGAGWYTEEMTPAYLIGDDTYRDDVMYYAIEECEPNDLKFDPNDFIF